MFLQLSRRQRVTSMRTEYVSRSRFSESDESGCESDGSMKGLKSVQFCGCKEEENCEQSKQPSGYHKECRKKSKKHGFDHLKIKRGGIPDGSDLFRQVLEEIQSESDNAMQAPRSDSRNSKPLKSILKHKS